MTKEKNKHTIFIVDDDSFMLDMYALKFRESGFEVVTSLGGEDALNKLRNEPNPDIMLLDIIMPDLDGLELLTIAKKEGLVEKTIAVALTNQWQEEEIARAKKLGVDNYIIKANTIPSEVLDSISKIIKKHHK